MKPMTFRQFLVFMIALVLSMIMLNCSAQTLHKDASGNWYIEKTTKADSGKETGKTFTDSKGQSYPVYLSARGKYYIIRKSASGNTYKYYLKV